MLILYKNITPNYSKTHYYFKDFNKYLTFLIPNKVTEIDNKRYTLENGFIRVAINDKVTDVNYNEITYIVDTHNNVCYHVSNISLRTTYVRYDVNVDLWGSYIYKAQLSNINVLKCNRKISDNGIYDDIQHTKDYEYDYLDNTTLLQFNEVALVITVKVGSLIKVLYHNLQFLYESIKLDHERFGEYIPIDALLGYVGSITQFRYPGRDKYFDVSILNAYIVPFSVMKDTWIGNTAKLNGKREEGTAKETQWFIAQPRVFTITKTLTMEANKRYSVGSLNGNINVYIPVNKTRDITYSFITSNNEIEVIVSNGDTTQNITNSFSVAVSDVNEQARATNGIARVLRYISGVAHLGIGIGTGRIISAVGGASSIANDIIADTTQQPQNYNVVGGGDALVTWGDLDYEYGSSGRQLNAKLPFYVITAKSLVDEEKRVRKTGAIFNEYIDVLENVFTLDLLGTGEATDDTYLLCKTDIANIPTNAIDVIENKLRIGIYLQYLS